MRNIFRLGFYILFCPFIFVLSSCINESDVITDRDVSKAVVNLTFKTERQENVTRSLSSSDDSENRIDCISILVFDSNGNLIGNLFETYSTAKTSSFSASVPCRISDGCTVCAVANAPETLFTDINTLAGFNDLYTEITTADDLDNGDHIIMFGKQTEVSVTSGGVSTTISLKRLTAKVTFNIAASNGFVVTGYQLCHVPMSSRVTEADSSDYNPSAVYDDLTKVTGLSADSVRPTFYMYENLAGTKTGAMSFAERNASNAAANASYLVIYTQNTSFGGEYTYTVYLGGTSNDDYTNYNILRNCGYTYTINISGADILDVRVEEINPQIGDIYYSDGTWSSTLDVLKTPVGIIFSTTTSTTDYNNGFTHGYVMALKNASTSCAWGSANTYTSTVTTDISAILTDYDGYTYTTLESSCAAASAAKGYTGATAPAGTSGWYLPSIGQWFQICVNLGGRDGSSSGYIDVDTYIYWSGQSFACATAINSTLSDVGSENYDAFAIGQYYWNSSEYSSSYAYVARFDSGGNVGLISSSKTDSHYVRAVLAF
jgi:hypothetical protein